MVKTEDGVTNPSDKGGEERPRLRPRLRKVLCVAFCLYMALGYLTTAFKIVDMAGPAESATPFRGPERTLLSGVFSVHTGRSHDATGTRDQVAAAASRADLDFVVIGDHPPDDRRPDWAIWEPGFYDGVFIDGGVELRAPEAGKVLAMGVDSTYKQWQGDLGSFIGFLDRQEATSMVVHARGPRGSERWVHDQVLGLQGWEVLDISEAARARLSGGWGPYHIILSLVGFPLGLADESMLHLMRDGFDTPTVAAYDSLRQRGPLSATAGLNVHPKLKLGPMLVPSYGPFFRTLVSHIAVDAPLPPEPAVAQEVIAEGLRRGEIFISLGDDQRARGFGILAVTADGRSAGMGNTIRGGGPMVLKAGFQNESGRKVVYRILRDGVEVEWVEGPGLEWATAEPGFYRVEVYNYGVRLGPVFFRLKPWIFANPIGLTNDGEAVD